MTTKRKIRMQLDCPMPRLDFDRITLGHGSGGLLTNRLLDKVVFALLGNEALDRRHDGAVLEFDGPVAFTTDSFVISPVIFPGGNIGELAVNGTINDLAMCGAMPHSLSLGLILEEGLPIEELWEILLGIRAACDAAGVRIATGDTKVVERGKGDKVFINTTGLGTLHPRADIGPRRVEAGDRIILSGPIATHGIAIMSVREGLEFETSIESDTRPLHEPVRALLDAFGPDIHLLRDPTRGGVATVLNEVARDTRTGIRISQQALPIEPQVEGACEMLGLDPLYVANEGIFLAFAKKDIADEAVALLQQRDDTARATIIGEVVDEHPGQVVLRSRIGGTRVVNMLTGEQLPRIC